MGDGINQQPASKGETEPTPEEALQLLAAFNRITDPEIKRDVLLLAQQLASGNPRFSATLSRLIRKH